MDFSAKYKQSKQQFEQHLYQYLEDVADGKNDTVYQAMWYSLEAGGKRFRPVLHLETVKLFGGNPQEFLDSACALEYIHTYSLIHDDLPVMDNDDYRRGKLTNHKVFGEAMAILAGDALLNRAFEILFHKIEANPAMTIVKGASYIAQNAGCMGMIAGQVVDLESEGKKIDKDTLYYIHDKKTAALIEASILSAAYMMDADKESLDALFTYAEKLGIAFQISDDILDVEGSFEQLGKPIGSDVTNQKTTFVSYYGLENARQILKETVEEAVRSLAIFDNKEFFVGLAEFMLYRKK